MKINLDGSHGIFGVFDAKIEFVTFVFLFNLRVTSFPQKTVERRFSKSPKGKARKLIYTNTSYFSAHRIRMTKLVYTSTRARKGIAPPRFFFPFFSFHNSHRRLVLNKYASRVIFTRTCIIEIFELLLSNLPTRQSKYLNRCVLKGFSAMSIPILQPVNEIKSRTIFKRKKKIHNFYVYFFVNLVEIPAVGTRLTVVVHLHLPLVWFYPPDTIWTRSGTKHTPAPRSSRPRRRRLRPPVTPVTRLLLYSLVRVGQLLGSVDLKCHQLYDFRRDSHLIRSKII